MDGTEVNSLAVSFVKELRTQCRESAWWRLLGVSVAALGKKIPKTSVPRKFWLAERERESAKESGKKNKPNRH